MNFLNALKQSLNRTKTFNGADALLSTDSHLVDLFGTIGALRKRSDQEIEWLFGQAFSEDRLLALKLLFYARDVRGGLGERRVARVIYMHLAYLHPEVFRKNLHLLSYYGRWDDLLCLLETPLKADVVLLLKQQMEQDVVSEQPSLLGKWLPSINTSSKSTRHAAQVICRALGWREKQYRQTLAMLRNRLQVVETKMSDNQWETIEFSHVPSNAMSLYSRAFMRHQEERFNAYIKAVSLGEETIHATVLYPYNIVERILSGQGKDQQAVLEEQWRHLPDYSEGALTNTLVMADVSGSMTGRPMATAIGLALYFAERTQGPFAGHFMTFSESPALVKVTGESLYERVFNARGSQWGMNTNFERALQVILDTAKARRVTQQELPETLIVISDMQFDESLSENQRGWTFYQGMVQRYRNAGYCIPEIVFWNVNSLSNVFQATATYQGVKFASGQSPSVFKSILNSKAFSVYDFMLEVLESERYQCIAI